MKSVDFFSDLQQYPTPERYYITNTKSNLLYVICTKYCTLHTETDFGIFAVGQRENLYIYSRFIIVQRASTQIHNPFLQTSMGKTKKNEQSTNNN